MGIESVFYVFETLKQKIMSTEKDLNYWKANAEEDYKQVPISVLRYITELETVVKNCSISLVSVPLNIQEELFNAGFDEGYTNPMEIDGRSISEKQYEEGRKHNFKQWVNER